MVLELFKIYLDTLRPTDVEAGGGALGNERNCLLAHSDAKKFRSFSGFFGLTKRDERTRSGSAAACAGIMADRCAVSTSVRVLIFALHRAELAA